LKKKGTNGLLTGCKAWEVEGFRQRGRPKRPDGIVLMKVLAYPKRMHSSGIDGEGELRGQLANPG